MYKIKIYLLPLFIFIACTENIEEILSNEDPAENIEIEDTFISYNFDSELNIVVLDKNPTMLDHIHDWNTVRVNSKQKKDFEPLTN